MSRKVTVDRVLVEAVYTTDAVRKGDGGWVPMTEAVRGLIDKGVFRVLATSAPADGPAEFAEEVPDGQAGAEHGGPAADVHSGGAQDD